MRFDLMLAHALASARERHGYGKPHLPRRCWNAAELVVNRTWPELRKSFIVAPCNAYASSRRQRRGGLRHRARHSTGLFNQIVKFVFIKTGQQARFQVEGPTQVAAGVLAQQRLRGSTPARAQCQWYQRVPAAT